MLSQERRDLGLNLRHRDEEGPLRAQRRDSVREHYSTVTPDEQRSSIGNVVQLFGRAPSGEGSGEGPPQVGRK